MVRQPSAAPIAIADLRGDSPVDEEENLSSLNSHQTFLLLLAVRAQGRLCGREADAQSRALADSDSDPDADSNSLPVRHLQDALRGLLQRNRR